MKIDRFEDIIAWQRSKEMCVEVYRLFGECKDFGFRDQITRASVSVMNNIAEGFERHTDKEFRFFLYVSKGSCGEVRSMAYLAHELNKITKEESIKIIKQAEEISRLIAGLIKSLGVK